MYFKIKIILGKYKKSFMCRTLHDLTLKIDLMHFKLYTPVSADCMNIEKLVHYILTSARSLLQLFQQCFYQIDL